MRWGERGGAVPGADLGTARFETFLRRLFSVKGNVAPAVEPKLQAGLDLLTPPWELAENALLAGWRGFQANDYEGPVAGQYSSIQLQNPVGSNIVCVVTTIWTQSNAAAGAYALFVDTIPGTIFGGAAVATRVRTDTRGVDPLTLQGGAVVTSGSGVGAPPYQSRVIVQPTTGGTNTPVLYVITPGYGLLLQGGALNTEIRAGLAWFERALEPSEAAAR